MLNLRAKWFCLLGLCILTHFLRAETRHIHFIKVFDSDNQDYVIREGCRSIGYSLDTEINLLAANLGIDNVIPYNVSGPNFSLETLDRVIDYDMSYQERDIVVFAYVGHGYRDTETSGPYPNLYFNSYDYSVNFAEIQERIMDKNPSLLINLVIACNVTVSDFSTPPPYESVNTAPDVVSLPKQGRYGRVYNSLFADEPGHTKAVNLFSADEEYYTFISNDGGIFFNEIIYTLQDVLGGKAYDGWGDICRTIEQRTMSRSERKGLTQKPRCEYIVRISPIAVAASRRSSFFAPSTCELAARDLRRNQRDELRQLRRTHRTNMRDHRRNNNDRAARRLFSQRQRVEYENRKLSHEQEYQRRLQICR